MDVRELNEDYINELRERYWFDNCEECQYYYNSMYDIDNQTIYNWYEQFDFVEDDFFCCPHQ